MLKKTSKKKSSRRFIDTYVSKLKGEASVKTRPSVKFVKPKNDGPSHVS